MLDVCDYFAEESIKGVNAFSFIFLVLNSLLKLSTAPQWLYRIFYTIFAYKWYSAELNKIFVCCQCDPFPVKQSFL